MANDLLMLIKLDADTMAFASLLVSIVGAVAAFVAAFYANTAAFYAKKAASKRDSTPVEQNRPSVEHFSNKIFSIDIPIHTREKLEDSQAQVQREASQPIAEREISPAQREASPAEVERRILPAQQQASHIQTQGEVSPLEVERQSSPPQTQQEVSQVQAQEKQKTTEAGAPRISISVDGEAMGEVPLELFLSVQDSSVRVSRVERLNKAGNSLGSSPCKATDNALVFKSILAIEKVRQWWSAAESTSEGETRNVLRVYLRVDESGKEIYRDIPVSIAEGLRNVGIATLVVWTIKGSI